MNPINKRPKFLLAAAVSSLVDGAINTVKFVELVESEIGPVNVITNEVLDTLITEGNDSVGQFIEVGPEATMPMAENEQGFIRYISDNHFFISLYKLDKNEDNTPGVSCSPELGLCSWRYSNIASETSFNHI